MRPNFLLVGCTTAACRYAEGFDGTAWEAAPFKGRVIRARGEASKALFRAAEFDDFLIDDTRQLRARWRGKDRLFERAVDIIDVQLRDGLTVTYYIDEKTSLVLANRTAVPIHARGEHIDTITKFEDWRAVNGVLYPYTLTSFDPKTMTKLGSDTWDSIEANVPYDAAFFSPPSTANASPLTKLVVAMRDDRTADISPYVQFHDANPHVDSEEDLTWLGYEALKDGDYARAFAAFNRVITEHPRSPNAFDSLGDAYAQQGNREGAIEAYTKALALDDNANATRAKLERLEKR